MTTQATYELVARTLRDMPRDATKLQIGEALAVAFAQDNPRFNPRRFFDAALIFSESEIQDSL